MTQPPSRTMTGNAFVVSFTLPSSGERWNWPLRDETSVDAFVEILDRANIASKIRVNW